MNKSLHNNTVAELSQMIANKAVSPTELVEHYFSRIETHNPALNAYVYTNKERSLEYAKQAEQQIASGEATPLTGVPIAQKDIFCTKDMPTTCASKMLKDFTATYNATVIEKCHQQGLVSLGKLNMDEFAMGSTNANSALGEVLNPWNHDYCPGGSSGGSAAAVSARLAPAATGTDTGGSIRQPAAFTGITGIKPTYGRISRFGMIAFASSLDQAGPMTQTAYDSALLLNALSGHDPKDATSSSISVPDFTDGIDNGIAGLRIGIPEEYFGFGLNPECEAVIQEAIKTLEKQGAKIVPIHLSNLKYAIPTYYLLAPIECASNLARFDGVHYGYRHHDSSNIQDMYELSREYGFGDEVKRRILIGTFASSGSYSADYYKKALKAKHVIRSDYKKAFAEVDAILTPTTTSTAFKLNDSSMTPQQMYLSDIYTVSVNLAGLPGISFPVGFSKSGMPIGAQLIGSRFKEDVILRIAHSYQSSTDWHSQCPSGYQD